MNKILFFPLFFFVLYAQDKEVRVLNELAAHQKIIMQAANSFGVSPRVVASVIYTERLLNYNFDDAILDDVLAQSGYNSSVGFGQIKVNTAFWVEQELNNPQSNYFLENTTIKRSASRKELIKKLVNDTTNIYYCSAYLAMIKERWSKVFIFRTENEAGILATLYSLGLFNSNSKERIPHNNPQMNFFGKTAQEFFDGFALRNVFN